MDLKVLVAVHKPYWMPTDDVYVPIQVGCKGKGSLGFTGDDTGENISAKNANFCELTGLYWAWKNLRADYIGLCHYRRYFAHCGSAFRLTAKKNAILERLEYEKILSEVDCILPMKRHYFIETVRSQYEHAHYRGDLAMMEQIISVRHPDYQEAFQRVMSRRSLHIFSMFVMKWELYDDYCRFLFDVLFELEKKIDISHYNLYEARVFGFLSERLLDVWIEKNHIHYAEVPVVFLEKINWFEKGRKFLLRKFMKRQG